MAPEDDDNFLQRWSRRKQEATRERRGDVAPQPPPADGTPRQLPVTADTAAEAGAHSAAPANDGAAAVDPIAALQEIDLDSLDFSSDYTQFMREGVPDELRTGALRKLWASDPVFAIMDGLDDYCEDFSDAVWADPGMKTAYRIGSGFLDEQEIAQWAELGRPQPAVEPEGAEISDKTAQSVPAAAEPVSPVEVSQADAAASLPSAPATADQCACGEGGQAGDAVETGGDRGSA